MTETLRPNPVPREVLVTRRWIEEDIIANGFCPPLNRVAQASRTEEGILDWKKLAADVDIVSYQSLQSDDPTMAKIVERDYFDYIQKAVNNIAVPLTRLFVFSDFPTNKEFTKFVWNMKLSVMNHIENTKQGNLLADIANKKYNAEQKRRRFQGKYTAIATHLVFRRFNPTPFYGAHLAETDMTLQFFDDSRGPKVREQVLSRAPYYMFQVLNVAQRPELDETLNTKKLIKRNTDTALQIGAEVYNARMEGIRYL